MAGVGLLAELVATLEKEACALQGAAASASEKDLRAAATRAVAELRRMRSQAAQVVANATLVGDSSPQPLLGYSDSRPAIISGVPAEVPVPRDLPAGPVEPMDRENLTSVVGHMNRYEGSAAEAGKALRAVASLAYQNAALVGNHEVALPQALRLLSLHPTEEAVQINGMRALCNMAYDPQLALSRLSTPPVLAAFINAMAKKKGKGEVCAKASEAIARVVAAEVGPENETPAVPPEEGPLRVLFTVVTAEDGAGREVVVQLVQQLVNNEVAAPELLAQRLIDLAVPCKENGATAAAWLLLAKQLAMAEISTMSESLISRGAIAAAAGVMTAQSSHAPAQLAGIEAMSGLVGSRWIGLTAFAAVKGIDCIEAAMGAHENDAVLQTKGIRALASGIMWPEDIQTKASYNYRRGVQLTKGAMAKHGECEDLQVAGLEALQKYLDRVKCVEEVKQDGGTGLVKAMYARHQNIDKVKALGGSILDALGEKDWKLKGQSA